MTNERPRRPTFVHGSLESGRSFIARLDVADEGGDPYHTIRLTSRSSQPLAVPMFSFHMTSTLNSEARLAAASGG